MAKFKKLLTGIAGGKKLVPSGTVKKQVLASALAWQILNEYPNRKKPYTWKKYNNLIGVLLADEVGEGKTFEALSIISKDYLQRARNKKKRFRVLIIAAPSIRSKWEWCPSCMEDKQCSDCGHGKDYDLSKFISQTRLGPALANLFAPSNPKEYSNKIIKSKKDWAKVFKSMPRQGVWLTSVNALPETRDRKKDAKFVKKYKFHNNAFDWIIADEAHIIRSGHSVPDEYLPELSNKAVRKIHAAINSNMNAKVLFLTATPYQNNVKELIQIISMLEKQQDDFGITSIITEALLEFQKRMDEFRENPSCFDKTQIRDLYHGLNDDITNFLKEKNADLKRPQELKRCGHKNGLDDCIRDIMVRNRKKPLNIDTSVVSLNEREKLQYLLFRDLVSYEENEEKVMVSTSLSELISSPGAFKRSIKGGLTKYKLINDFFRQNLIFERKYSALVEQIIKISTKNSDKKVIAVYCRFIPTMKELETRLASNGWKVFMLDGSVKVNERKERLKEIGRSNKAKSIKPIIFLVSQVGNEGLDFDGFSDTIMHFDGHYNPAVIDQRNGRVYRGGNTHKNIKVLQILLGETYDQRIKFIEQEKRKMKDFYLGDKDLDMIFEKILKENQKLKEEHLKRLLKFKIDLAPKKGWLFNKYKSEVN